MASKNIIDEAISWAQNFKEHSKSVLSEMEIAKEQGEEIDLKKLKDLQMICNMSIDDLKKAKVHQMGLNNFEDISDKQFVEFNKVIGLSPTQKESLEIVFAERIKEYSDHYKVDKSDPGMMFIIKQIIQDELQVIRLRQDMVMLEVKQDSSETKDDIQKRLIDSINKINKMIFEFTKYLQQWHEEVERIEAVKTDKKESATKRGLKFSDLVKSENDPSVTKAKKTQLAKRSQYVEMVEFNDA